MPVGSNANSSTVDLALTSLATQMRQLMQNCEDLSTWINGQGQGLQTLEALGYDAADAQQASTLIAYLNTVAGVYFGTATQASEFNFNNALSQVWAGA